MLNINKHLPRRYRINFKRARKQALREAKIFVAELSEIRNIRNGSRASRVVRHFTDKLNIKAILGGNITLMVLAAGMVTPQTSNILAQTQPEAQILPADNTHVTTEVNIRYPLEKFSFNQSFSSYHPGVDFGDPIGTPVFSIENGDVLSTEYDKFGYGNSIVVSHKDGITTRYAHLSRIDVRPGDPVTTSTQIGLTGNTGRSTGPHLHFEVRKNNVPLNPIAFLGPIPAK
jgi:murein DD-endopeptidase MepM/ murein hydrolase activator NlpD